MRFGSSAASEARALLDKYTPPWWLTLPLPPGRWLVRMPMSMRRERGRRRAYSSFIRSIRARHAGGGGVAVLR